jgi:polyhydroxybutyrate depolymerase
MLALSLLIFSAAAEPDKLGPGDHTRTVTVGGLERTYQVHIPKQYDKTKPTPLVLAIHGLMMTGPMMIPFCGLDATSDKEGFIVMYPNSTVTNLVPSWSVAKKGKVDDVAAIGKMLDDLATVANIDANKTYACGMSNGGMMCYRLALDMPERIAAIAPVAGIIPPGTATPKRRVPILHSHGTRDTFVPYDPSKKALAKWVTLNNCDEKPAAAETITKKDDPMPATRTKYEPKKDGEEVVMIAIEGAGHTWPGKAPLIGVIGKSNVNVPANEMIWEFFKNHPMK